MCMATSHCLQPGNQVIKREEESAEYLRSNCVKKEGEEKIKLSYTLASKHMPQKTSVVRMENRLTNAGFVIAIS